MNQLLFHLRSKGSSTSWFQRHLHCIRQYKGACHYQLYCICIRFAGSTKNNPQGTESNGHPTPAELTKRWKVWRMDLFCSWERIHKQRSFLASFERLWSLPHSQWYPSSSHPFPGWGQPSYQLTCSRILHYSQHSVLALQTQLHSSSPTPRLIILCLTEERVEETCLVMANHPIQHWTSIEQVQCYWCAPLCCWELP